MSDELDRIALDYHMLPTPGKISMRPTKPCKRGYDLSLAYTPGVAAPCLAIKDDISRVWDYTSKGNMVAVVSDGTAVLGLGNIGPEAGLPVMEGKSVLFKHFADIDAIGICLSKVFDDRGRTDPARLISVVESLEPSFGGINLEDIGSPACFEVEKTLKRRMGIPVFHDDQHGTAIISYAAIRNALKLIGKRIEDCRFVVSGAGAAGISCCEFYIKAGARRENFILCDSHGVIHSERKDLNPQKRAFAVETPARTLADAVRGADIFLGFSVPGCLTADMVRTMADGPVIFPMANPVPEIFPEIALAAGASVVGTGRSDFPNQINNVLGFPGIFRGALDVRASDINDEMKLAAGNALADLAEEPLSPEVREGPAEARPDDAQQGRRSGDRLRADMVIPKPFDDRVVPRVARKVAEAAIASGVAQRTISDFDVYEKSVRERIRESRAGRN
ncbi:MAG: NAD-dependent malic enzyme [Victivallaceae bacterium]|nr:NAD-dependent malic enzyme [Victivallaceae bacterium]